MMILILVLVHHKTLFILVFSHFLLRAAGQITAACSGFCCCCSWEQHDDVVHFEEKKDTCVKQSWTIKVCSTETDEIFCFVFLLPSQLCKTKHKQKRLQPDPVRSELRLISFTFCQLR